MKQSKKQSNHLSQQSRLKLAYSNFMERKWRNLVISLATSIGFIGILISLGLGNAILKVINKTSSQMPAQVQIALNKEVANTGVLNHEDRERIEKVVQKDKIKYLEAPFGVMMQEINLEGEGRLDVTQELPSYAQIVSLYDNTAIKVVANRKKDLLAGKVYTDNKEEGITLTETFLTDFNKKNKTTFTPQSILGKTVTVTIMESQVEETKTGKFTTKVIRVLKDKDAERNSYMSGRQLSDIISKTNFTKTIPYFILEMKNPDDTQKASKSIQKYKKYMVISQQQILSILINFIKIIQGLLIVLSSQAILVSVVMIGVIVYINIMQRSKEIGVMKAVGYLDRDVKSIFIYESLLITVISLGLAFVVSNIIGLGANYVVDRLYQIETIYALNLWSILGMFGFAILIGYLAAYFPTKRISKLDPVDSIRYE